MLTENTKCCKICFKQGVPWNEEYCSPECAWLDSKNPCDFCNSSTSGIIGIPFGYFLCIKCAQKVTKSINHQLRYIKKLPYSVK